LHYTPCGQERVFPEKTAEGACATLNGGLNAQAKGLATALAALAAPGVPNWREAAFSRRSTEGASLHRRVNLSGKEDSRGSPRF
jgi:hypothetical protein